MKLFGIFDLNNNYELLRYSTWSQEDSTYEEYNPETKVTRTIHEHCLPDIEYSTNFLGKHYNPSTGEFDI